MIKAIRDLPAQQKKIYIWFIIAVCIFEFFYINWFSYELALHHYDDELLMPLGVAILSAIGYGVVKLVEKKRKKPIWWKYFLTVVFVAAVLAAVFHGYCPACNNVRNPVYKILFRLFTGEEYEFD